MEEKILPLTAITCETRNWSAQVRVVTKLAVKTAIKSPTKYQKLILADESGDTVEAVIFKSDIDLYKDNLEQSKTYKISNAHVTEVNEIYRNELISSPYQWTINSHTSVMPLDEDVIPTATFRPDFIASAKFTEFLNTKKLIFCVIIEKRNPRKISVRGQQHVLHEYAAIDKQTAPFLVTFWNDIITDKMYATLDSIYERPVIALLNFIVTGFYGLSLSSTSSSIVLNEMQNESFAELRTWRIQERLFIDEIVERGGFFEERIDIKSGQAGVTILDVLQTKELGRFTIIVKGCLDNESQSFVYMCCEDCRSGINVAYNSLFKCNTCNINKIAKPRFRFRLTVFDHTGKLEVTIFGKDAEMILGMSAQQFHDQTENSGASPTNSVNPRLKDVTMCMKIRSSLFSVQNGREITVYNLLAMEFMDSKAGIPLLKTSSPQKNKSTGVESTPKKQDKTTKKKLDFGNSLNTTHEELTTTTSGYVSMKRRLVKMGKAKIGEKNEHTESDVEPFEETPPHSSDSSNQSLDDLITLSDLVQSNKARRLAITTSTGQANSKQLKQGMDNEKFLEEDCEEFTSPILVKTEEKDSNHIDKARKKQFTKKSLRYIVLDENSFEEELNIGKELVQQQSPTKDVGKEISKLKRSTRGRVIRPKKYN